MSASASDASTNSTQTLTTALVLYSVIAGVELLAFILLRRKFKKIYQPRTYLVPPKEQSEPLPTGLLSFFPAVLKADATQIIEKNGLDAYVFVRFLYLMIEIFLPIVLVSWPLLLPIYSANSGGTGTGVTIFTFGNVGTGQQPRYAASLIVAYLITFWVMYLIRRELSVYAVLRQEFLIAKQHSKRPQSRTVLVTGVPKDLLTPEKITKFCNFLPGGVKRVWLARNLRDLPEVYERRQVASARLESAEFNLLKSAAQVILDTEKEIAKAAKKNNGKAIEGLPAPSAQDLEADPSLVAKYVSGKDRPHHRLGFFGLWGKKVDSIDWAREEIVTTSDELKKARVVLGYSEVDATYPAESAAFIEFNQQIAAHMFAQCLAHDAPLMMSSRYLEVDQEDVIWENLSIGPLSAKGRYVISWAVTIALVVFWAIPVAFVGILSNVSALCIKVSWLAWLCTLPSPVNGIIQGALPPLLLAILFMLLPIILRLFAKYQGIPLRTQVELSLMTRYFIFLVVNGFLVVTVSAGLVAAIPQIAANPSSAVTLLAQQLPTASTFFLTYFVLTTFAGSAGALLQIVPLIIFYAKLYLLGSTPRSVYGIRFKMGSVAWGTLFPNMTLLTVIGLTYSVISPLVSGFALFGFTFFWFVYKYLFLWVFDLPKASETGGLFYTKMIDHIFVGLYIGEFCLTGLFFLAQNSDGKQSAIPEGAIMIVLIVITVLFQITMSSSYGPLVSYLPMSLATRMSEIHGEDQAADSPPLGPFDSRKSDEEKKDAQPLVYPPPERKDERESARLVNRGEGSAGAGKYEEEDDEELGVHAFDHPATYEAQKTIWMPADAHGFYKGEVAAVREAGIDVSTDGAVMNLAGKVQVSRSPPGEAWNAGMSLQ